MPEDHPMGDWPARPESVIFQPESFVLAADHTEICAFLNPYDTRSGPLPDPAAHGVSVAAGRIGPGVRSAVHVHPVLTQITYVTAGTLTALMRDPRGTEAYRVEVPAGAATRTDCGTLLQLCNETDGAVEALYVSAPAYILETAADGSIRDEGDQACRRGAARDDGRLGGQWIGGRDLVPEQGALGGVRFAQRPCGGRQDGRQCQDRSSKRTHSQSP